MIEQEIRIANRAGIHARPAALIVQTAAKFKSRIMLAKSEMKVNAKSIMGIITLGAGFGTILKLNVEGEDEAAAASALATLFEKKFEED